MSKEGDIVEVIKSDNSKIKGILMHSHSKDSNVVKLSSGYNLAINKNKIKNITILKKLSKNKKEKIKIKHKKGLKTVAVLHTGGTIASEVDYETGAVTPRFSPEELIEMFPEIEEIINVKSRLIANISSEDMNFSHYNLLAKEIEKAYDVEKKANEELKKLDEYKNNLRIATTVGDLWGEGEDVSQNNSIFSYIKSLINKFINLF